MGDDKKGLAMPGGPRCQPTASARKRSSRSGITIAEPRTWMKEPCGPCPFSRSKTLWLHPERAADFASMASNPYSDFPCHKTADLREDEEGHGEYVFGGRSLTCNGFLSLQVNENGWGPIGFTPHSDAFGDYWEMCEHHEERWEDERSRRAQAIEARRAETGTGSVHESAVANGHAPKETHHGG